MMGLIVGERGVVIADMRDVVPPDEQIVLLLVDPCD